MKILVDMSLSPDWVPFSSRPRISSHSLVEDRARLGAGSGNLRIRFEKRIHRIHSRFRLRHTPCYAKDQWSECSANPISGRFACRDRRACSPRNDCGLLAFANGRSGHDRSGKTSHTIAADLRLRTRVTLTRLRPHLRSNSSGKAGPLHTS